jgi:hypothetical protein
MHMFMHGGHGGHGDQAAGKQGADTPATKTGARP